jgi:hypothetical protein
MWFGLFRFRSPLLTESRLLSLPVGTEMFHFPTFPPHALCVQAWVTGHDSCRVSPFGHPRIKVRSTTPRGLSQSPTSFIGSWCQGIHRAPLLTCAKTNYKDARVHYAVLKVRATPSTTRRVHRYGCRSAISGVRPRPAACLIGIQTSPEGVLSTPSGLNSVPTYSSPSRSRFLLRRQTGGTVLTTSINESDELVSVPPLSYSLRAFV